MAAVIDEYGAQLSTPTMIVLWFIRTRKTFRAETLRSPGKPVAPPAAPLVRVGLNLVDTTRSDRRGEDIYGVGLHRIEFLLTASTDGLPVIIGTFDIRGDAPFPCFSLSTQQNPYLGLRATVADVKLQILYTMVESVDDLILFQDLVMRATKQLDQEGVPFQRRFEQGVLIEMPSAVWTLPELLGDQISRVSARMICCSVTLAVDRASASGSVESYRALADHCLGASRIEDVHFFMDEFESL